MDNNRDNSEYGNLNTLPPSLPVMAELAEKRKETPKITSLLFNFPRSKSDSFRPFNNQPGQFVMVWIPGFNEKPFVISYFSDNGFGITVMVRGDFSRRLADLKIGRKVGFRGPFGRGFSLADNIPREDVAIIGGGCGMAPLALLGKKLPGAAFIQGAPGKDDILFTDRFPHQIIFTEDGSLGIQGMPTDWLKGHILQYDIIYTCGPEAMMKAVHKLCIESGTRCQAALERYMKCGIGVCGQCDCDGKLVCKDGPVFNGEELNRMPSFARMRRDETGQRVSV